MTETWGNAGNHDPDSRRMVETIRARTRAYGGHPRHDGDTLDLLALKIETSHWRRVTAHRLLDMAEGGKMDAPTLAGALLELKLFLFEEERSRLAATVREPEILGRVLAQMGIRHPEDPDHHLLAGPDTDLKIEVNRVSLWPFQRWKEIRAFGEHEFTLGGVRYRGLEMAPGDMILANANLDGNFVFSSLPDPKGLFSHAAVFVILEEEGRRYPAVVETYERGVRAVPLSVFLNARYVAYAEIYRHRGVTSDHHAGLAEAAMRVVRETRGYNFHSCDTARDYISCTSLGRILLEDVGLPPVEPRSGVVNPGILRTLDYIDYRGVDPFFAPVDYLLNPDFRFVGFVDNNQVHRVVAREVVEAVFRERVARGTLGHRRLPLPYYLNLWAIGQVRRGTTVGRVISRFAGFDAESLPKGPDPTIAIIPPAERELTRAVRRVLPYVEERLEGLEELDFLAFLRDPDVRRTAANGLGMVWL